MDIEDIKRVNFHPGDHLLVKVPDRILFERDAMENMRHAFSQWAGDVPVILYPASVSIEVINTGAISTERAAGDCQC